MVSSHVLYNDFGFEGYKGGIPLTKVPYMILSNLDSMRNISALEPYLSQLEPNPYLVSAGYVMQYLVTDGTITYVITPKSDGSAYEAVDISSLPKLTNFKWVEQATLERNDRALQARPTGVERWNAVENIATLEDLRFTQCYKSQDRLSEFIGMGGTTKESSDADLIAQYNIAAAAYVRRTRTDEVPTWHTIHSIVYSANAIEDLYVQENYDVNYGKPKGGEVPSIEGVLKFSESQTLTEDQFNQLMQNMQFGASKVTTEEKELFAEALGIAVTFDSSTSTYTITAEHARGFDTEKEYSVVAVIGDETVNWCRSTKWKCSLFDMDMQGSDFC